MTRVPKLRPVGTYDWWIVPLRMDDPLAEAAFFSESRHSLVEQEFLVREASHLPMNLISTCYGREDTDGQKS